MSLRVGIVGYGEIAAFHARHLTAAGVRIAGVVTSRSTPPDIERYQSLSAMLRHVDAVTIAVPNHLHAALCVEAIAAGVAVFVEKPLCITPSELRTVEQALRGASRPVHVGMRLRWNPALRALRAGVQGVRRVRCVYGIGIDRLAAGKPWTRRDADTGGAFFTLGVHALDLARWFARADGRPLEHLRAELSERQPGADYPLVARLEGTLPDGARLEATADLRGDGAFRLELDVEADRGACSDRSLSGIRPRDAGAADAEYAGLMKHFVDAVAGGGTNRDEIDEILQCHRELIAARALALTRGS